MDEMMRWMPENNDAKRLEALQRMRETQIEDDCKDEGRILPYLAARENWLFDTPEGLAATTYMIHPEARCWTCFDLLMATRCGRADVKQLEGLADAEWFALFKQGKPLILTSLHNYVGLRQKGFGEFLGSVYRFFDESGNPIGGDRFEETATDRAGNFSHMLEGMNKCLSREEMEQFAICWSPEDWDLESYRRVSAPGGLSELEVDLDDKDSRLSYLANGYMKAAYDGYLTPEQAAIAGEAGKALQRELDLTDEDVKDLVEFQAELNRLNLLANSETDNPLKRLLLGEGSNDLLRLDSFDS